MKVFREFIKKEFFHIFRDIKTLLVLFGMPVAQLIIFGYAIRMEISDADIGILDHSKDHVTQDITNKILSSDYFKLKKSFENINEVEAAFQSGEVNEVIVFEPLFAHKLYKDGQAEIQILTDASDPNVATLIKTYTASIITDYQQNLNKSGIGSGFIIKPEVKMMYNQELKSVYMFVPGLIAIILMIVSALMTSIALTKEKEYGSMEVLLASPLKPQIIILGKVLPYVSLSLINAISIVVIAIYVFGVPFRGSFVLFFLESVLFIFTALSLGILISTVAKTQQVALMMSLAGLLMPTVLLSGFIFPVENMPVALQIISSIIPARWFLVIIKSIMLKGNGIEFFWKETLILIGMTLFFIALSIKKFKVRLD